MHIIVFNEYYPNPFKPSLTTEIEQFLNDNHKLTLFAMGGYWNPIDPKVRELGLDRLIRYLPTTLNSLPRFLGAAQKLCFVILGQDIGCDSHNPIFFKL